jgi:hypothetical protein
MASLSMKELSKRNNFNIFTKSVLVLVKDFMLLVEMN